MEALEASADFAPPSLIDIEHSAAIGLAGAASRGPTRGRPPVHRHLGPRAIRDLPALRAAETGATHAAESGSTHAAAARVRRLRRGDAVVTLVPSRRIDTDVAIVGSGFAGSLLALVLRQRGMRVALLERGRHPRFAIGESSTPLAGLLIEELADRYDLPRLRPFSKWGTWQDAYPDVACGLKRGFSFFQHETGRPFADDHTHARQLLVAASPNDAIADTHWYRPDFDHWLVREAEAAGVCYLDETSLDVPAFDQGHPVIEGTRRGERMRVDATFLVDASGPRGFLWSRLGLGDAPMAWLPPTQALYSHFEGVERWDSLVASDATPPYPVDDAARPSRVAGCVGVGAAIQQRRDERRRGGHRRGRASVRLRRRRGRLDAPAGRLPLRAGAVRGGAAVAAVRPRAARGAPDSRRRGSRLGAAAVGRRRHRSAAVHRLSLDPAWHRAAGSRARGDIAWKRARGGSRAICAGHDGRTRRHRTPGGGPLRARCRTSRCSSA